MKNGFCEVCHSLRYTSDMKRLDSYSQHFLRSPRLVAELVGHSNIRPCDLVLDLGAGSGIITSVLARRAGRVIAVESEPRTAELLRKNTAALSNVSIETRDILKVALPNEPYKVFANIPFHLSSPIVRRLTEAKHAPTSIYLIVQRQFANKLLANDKHFTSQLGAMIAPWWSVRIRKPLRKTDFTPPPAVDTVLIEIKQRSEPLLPVAQQPHYARLIETAFETPAYFARLPRLKAGISPELNPSQLTGEQWARLYLETTPR